MRLEYKNVFWKSLIQASYLVVLGAALVACGGGGGGGGGGGDGDGDGDVGGGPGPITPKSLTVVSDSSAGNGGPQVVIAGANASVQAWTDPYSGTLKQSLYASTDGSVQVRVKYDGNGQPARIEDDVTGTFIQVVPNGANRVDYLHYDANGNYQSGYAVYLVGDKMYVGRIVGKPAISDGQISGILATTGTTNANGSYSLIAQNSSAAGLADVTEVDAKTYAMLTNLLVAQENLNGRSSLTPVLATLADVLPAAGLLVAGGAVVVATVTGAPIAGAYLAAGAAMVILGPISGKLDQWVTDNFNAGDSIAQESVDTGLEVVVDPAASLNDFLGNLKGRLSDYSVYINTAVENAKADIESLSALSDFGGTTSRLESAGTMPTDGPDFIDTPVIGQAAFQNGAVYEVTGTADTNGTITATGLPINTEAGTSTVTINAELANDDTVTGQFNLSTGATGTVSGNKTALGACQTSQGSGGPGAFTYSHYVGSGSGDVSFFYDSYSIPDAFTVSTSSGVKFATPGLVSGSQTVILSMTDEPIVFVSVTAPNSGTAWDYSLGCLQ